jgi:hypothetical protein
MGVGRISRLIVLLLFVVSTIVSAITWPSQQSAYAADSTNCDYSFIENNQAPMYDPCSPRCSSSAAQTINALTGSDNRQKIWNYLIARGLSPEQTAGVMGNIQSESGGTFSPTINEYSQTFPGGGYGIVQWTGGRRDGVVQALKTAQPDLMKQYYNAAYSSSGSYTSASAGFVSKNKDTGVLMPVADNDALLLAELNFMVDESMARTLHQPAVKRGYGTSSDIEWDTIKKQTTIADASNVWVYSYEIPASIDTTAAARAINGQTIYNLYSSSSTGSSCTSNAGGNKQQLAQQILATNNITYDSGMPAAEKQIIPNIASGKNNGNDWPCGLNIIFLKGILAIAKEHKQRLNSLNRSCSGDVPPGSSTASRHYAGNGSAVDFGPIDGMAAYSAAGANLILKYMGPLLVNDSGIGQAVGSSSSNTSGVCLPSSVLSLPSGIKINRFGDFCTHLHMDVPPNADPSLKCKVPINYGGCDKSQQV